MTSAGSVASKTVFITGGARGVGAEVARRLHRRGARLVLTDLDEAPLAELRDTLGGDRVHTIVADVRDLSAMEAAAASAVERFGGIDVVMANAGIATYGSVLQVDPQAVRTLMDVNVMGVFHTVRATLPSVLDRSGYVLIVSSLAAYAAAPGLALTTPPRPPSNISPTHSASKSPTAASTSAQRTCPGSTHRWCATPRPICRPSRRC